jgi:hypothetical protein
LWKLFRMWRSHASVGPEADGNDVEEFCACVRARLEELVKERSETGHVKP